MIKVINKIRILLIKLTLSEDEKYLLLRAVEDRVDLLYKIRVAEKWADADSVLQEINDYKKLYSFLRKK